MTKTGYAKIGNDWVPLTLIFENGVLHSFHIKGKQKDNAKKPFDSDFDLINCNWASPFIQIEENNLSTRNQKVTHILTPKMPTNFRSVILDLSIWEYHWFLIRVGKHEIFEQKSLFEWITLGISVIALVISVIALAV